MNAISRNSAAKHNGAAMLDSLRAQLVRGHKDFDFEDGPEGQPRAIEVRRQSGELVAWWSRDGETLLFSAAPAHSRTAQSVDEALRLTETFLVVSRTRDGG